MEVTPTSGAADLLAMVSKALREAYNLGMMYWQQADSDYISQHKKSDDTRAKFLALAEETCAALAAGQATAAQQGVAYAALPEPYCNAHDDAGACYPDMFSEHQMRAFADATHTLRASHGQAPAGAGMGHTDGGRNMFYEGRFDGESQREQQARLRWANDMRAAFERHTGNGWFDKDWRTETGLWSSAWHACLAAQPSPTAQAEEAVALDHIAVIEDGELRYMTGRKAPAYDCELYAMPDGKRAPVLFTAPQTVAREPLTNAQREKIIEAVDWYNFPQDVIDAVERAHGITGGQHGAE